MQNFGGLCYFLFRFGESVFVILHIYESLDDVE